MLPNVLSTDWLVASALCVSTGKLVAGVISVSTGKLVAGVISGWLVGLGGPGWHK
jgi:hypothetical protein